MNAVNVAYIEQLEANLTDIKQVMEDEIRAKKKWRNTTLLIVGANVIFLTSIFLSR
jgi:hypothetical protein